MKARYEWVNGNMKGLIVMKSDSLAKFEPQQNETNWTKVMISFLTATGIFGAILYVIISNVNKVGKLKQQQVNLEMEQSFTYNMSSVLLPVHIFATMRKDEIMSRMDCTENLNFDACMNYCEMY